MLETLRGAPHYVATGHALLLVRAGTAALLHSGATVSRVTMRDYDDAEVEQYVGSGEPLDKAGAYAIQGLGGALVSEIEGCYYNVVGFPLCDVHDALAAAGAHLLPRPAGGYCEHCPLRAARR
jgi:septum formation protein